MGIATDLKGATVITFHRTVCTTPGTFPAAIANAKEVCALAKDVTGVDVSLSTQVGGSVGYLRWSATYDNLAGLENALTKLLASPKYWELVNKGAANIVAGTAQDEIWRTV
jgi:hypothetical protein